MMKSNTLLHSFGEDIWYVQESYRLMGANLGTKMTVIRLDSGGLFIHSPVKMNEKLLAELDKLGEPQFIVAPSIMHNLNADTLLESFPKARGYYSEGAKLPHVDKLNCLNTLDEFPWRNEVVSVFVKGMPKVNEWVFLHEKSGTLVVCDLFFNMVEPLNSWTRLFAKLYGVYGRTTVTRLYQMMINDKALFSSSMKEIMSLDFKSIIISHGSNVSTGGNVLATDAIEKVLTERQLT